MLFIIESYILSILWENEKKKKDFFFYEKKVLFLYMINKLY